MLQLSSQFVEYAEDIQRRAEILEDSGIMGMDAFHLACAEYAGVDLFVTCDDILIKKAQNIDDIKVEVISLLEFVYKEVFKNEA